MMTLIYQGGHQTYKTTEHFDTERELCQRVVGIAKDWTAVNFYLDQPGGHEPMWLNVEDVRQRLALIEARREAVAVALVAERPSYREPALTSAQSWYDLLDDNERAPLLAQADRLIAAYEGARV